MLNNILLNFFDNRTIFGILVFVGQGVSDAIFNDFAQNFREVLEEESYLFFMTLFIIAIISVILILTGKS